MFLVRGPPVVLSVLTYLHLHGGKKTESALEISILNLIILVGFGILVPPLAA